MMHETRPREVEKLQSLITEYYDSLTDQNRAKEIAWSEFAESQLAEAQELPDPV